MLQDLFNSAIRNLFRKKLRTVLTASGIIIGISSVIVIMTIGRGGQSYISDQLESLGLNGLNVRAKYAELSPKNYLTEADMDAIKTKVKGVESATPLSVGYGVSYLRGFSQDTVVWGVSSDIKEVMNTTLLYGRMINQSDIRNASSVCLVSDSFAQLTYKRENIVGKKLSLYLSGKLIELTVVGVIRSQGAVLETLVGEYFPTFVYLPYTSVQRLTGRTYLDQIAIRMADEADPDQTGEAIVQLLRRTHQVERGGYYADNMMQEKEQMVGIINMVTLIISAIAAISLLVGGLGIMTLMLVAVNERTREIGIKKAVGATRKNILTEFLLEAVLITSVGGIIGVGLGLGIAYPTTLLFDMPFVLDTSTILIAMSFSMGIGIIFGVYPARKAARYDPIEALRYE